MDAEPFPIPDDGLPGEFWLDGGEQSPGRLFSDEAGRPCVTTKNVIREWHSLRITVGQGWSAIDSIGSPEAIIADSIPMSVLGTLDDGRNITLRDSMLAGSMSLVPQTHVGLGLLVGAHAPSKQSLFTSA